LPAPDGATIINMLPWYAGVGFALVMIQLYGLL
jgi:hypothetical protein